MDRPPQGSQAPVTELFDSIATQFEIVLGNQEVVENACKKIQDLWTGGIDRQHLELLTGLLPLFKERSGPLAVALFQLFQRAIECSTDPRPLLRGLLQARERQIVLETLAITSQRVRERSLTFSEQDLEFFGGEIGKEDSHFHDPVIQERLGQIIRESIGKPDDPAGDPLVALFLNERNPGIRRLAATLLDLTRKPIGNQVAKSLLPSDGHEFLSPYLEFTRASALDLLSIQPEAGIPPSCLESLRRAEKQIGTSLLRAIISRIGWPRLAFGLEVHPLTGLSFAGTLPLFLEPWEARLFQDLMPIRKTTDSILVTAIGRPGSTGKPGKDRMDLISRFRTYNLNHAELLKDFLNVAPLDPVTVRRILAGMDGIIDDFLFLFSEHCNESAILGEVYGKLKRDIQEEIDAGADGRGSSSRLARLVQMFEDPSSLGTVHSLHGLKRYLHQKGLELGSKIVGEGTAPNRTVDIILCSEGTIRHVIQKISYSNFEPEDHRSLEGGLLPHCIDIVIKGFQRQLLHRLKQFPDVRIFCYGNEVHYYIWFLNHPVFLRIDYSPPLRGGMIQLEYFGVSQYELSHHPDLPLDSISTILQDLDFDVRLDGTHITARYDKERAVNFEALLSRAEMIFCLAPYLMDLGWTIGSLPLDEEARKRLLHAWSHTFRNWGTFPSEYVLSGDRKGVIESVSDSPAGPEEIFWSGNAPYKDRCQRPIPAEFVSRLVSHLKTLDLEPCSTFSSGNEPPSGQLGLEKTFLNMLRHAVHRGQLIETEAGGRLSPSPEFVRKVHAAGYFARILTGEIGTIAAHADLARLVEPLGRTVTFRTTGELNGYEVQHGILFLRGTDLSLFVLRDHQGMIRLAAFCRDDGLFESRKALTEPWNDNASCDVTDFAGFLRYNNFLGPGDGPFHRTTPDDARRIVELFRTPNPKTRTPSLPGQRSVAGLKAAPGRSVGRAVIGTHGHSPEDFDGAILVAPTIGPEDNTLIFHSAGILTTGGGILSHAGLLANQFGKPSLIISGQWIQESGGIPSLHLKSLEFDEIEKSTAGMKQTIRENWRERHFQLRHGDLVILDADAGTLQVLGQDQETLALQEAFRSFSDAARNPDRSESPKDILRWRGRRIRARHQIEKILGRLDDPQLICHAIHEIFLGSLLSQQLKSGEDRGILFRSIFANRAAAETARKFLLHLWENLQERLGALYEKARRRIRGCGFVWEVLKLRLDVYRALFTLRDAAAGIAGLDIRVPEVQKVDMNRLDRQAWSRIEALKKAQVDTIRSLISLAAGPDRMRPHIEKLSQMAKVAPLAPDEEILLRGIRTEIQQDDLPAVSGASGKPVLRSEQCRLIHSAQIGWKAGNLAEIETMGAAGHVPPWFVVTDHAFRMVCDAPIRSVLPRTRNIPGEITTLHGAIEYILSERELSDKQKSVWIGEIWDLVVLPDGIRRPVLECYRELMDGRDPAESPSGHFVAVRSSSREEDAATAARAGEFQTFLFVRGGQSVLEHLKKTWAGLWTERAIHNRSRFFGDGLLTGGGVIIQRVVFSRVSGVLQTVNVARNELDEIVINAGYGLGEGIVSGLVTSDLVTVSKQGDLEDDRIRFDYLIGDKREQIAFNKRTGSGTMRTTTLYHQRFRPALEYNEVCELVKTATRLEEAYGIPLDIEFAFEGTRLWILQVRPVPIAAGTIADTIRHFPLSSVSSPLREGTTP